MLALLVALMVLFFSFQSLFTRLYSAHFAGPDAAQSKSIFSVSYGVFIAIASLCVSGFSFAPSWQTWLLGLINAGMLLLYNTSIIEAGNRGSYSFLMISSMFGGILVPAAIGMLFLGETLTSVQIFAVVVMLMSLVVMNIRGISFKGNSSAYYRWCIVLFFSNGLYSAFMNLQVQIMGGAQRTEMLAILFAGSALAVVAAELMRGRGRQLAEGFRMGKRAALFLLICCVSAALAANLMLYTLPRMESSILFTIDNGGVLVMSILYSLILFKEKPRWEQVLGMCMAVLSIVLINLNF